MTIYDDIKEIVDKLNKIAKKYNIPIITSTQSRNPDNSSGFIQSRKTNRMQCDCINVLIIDYPDLIKVNNGNKI